jgi:penicillin-binding protein 1C
VGRHVVVVWTGRADGGARGGLTGRDAALPLLFDAADLIDAPAAAPRPIAPRAAPQALARLEQDSQGPRLIFPPDGSTVQVDRFGAGSRGLVLAAGGSGLSWYAGGQPLVADPVSGRVIWRPQGPGFYRLVVVDGEGRKATARVRVKAG